jgi:hypothetical protein
VNENPMLNCPMPHEFRSYSTTHDKCTKCQGVLTKVEAGHYRDAPARCADMDYRKAKPQ